jgi:Domain of unknown function (DUF1844)
VSGLAEDQPENGAEEVEDLDAEAALEAMMSAIREAPVAQLIVSSISTLASAAYAKLEAGDLVEAKTAIDAIDALLPVTAGDLDEGLRRDLGQALTGLKLAYADAVARPE